MISENVSNFSVLTWLSTSLNIIVNIMSRERFFNDKQRIIDTAISLICENGYESFSMRRLAASLGASPMTLYNYFSNKEEIVKVATKSAYEKTFEMMQNDIKNYLEGSPICPLMIFAKMSRSLLTFSRQSPQLYSLVFIMGVERPQELYSFREFYVYSINSISGRIADKNIEKELKQHIYLFQALVGALIRNIYIQIGPTDDSTFERNLALAYDSLLKPFEKYFTISQKHE